MCTIIEAGTFSLLITIAAALAACAPDHSGYSYSQCTAENPAADEDECPLPVGGSM